MEWEFKELRYACQCASCVDEFTGEQRINLEHIAKDVSVEYVEQRGNYAVFVKWSDGHDSLYPFVALLNSSRM